MTRRWFMVAMGGVSISAAVGRVPWPVTASAPTVVDLHLDSERVATVKLDELTFFQTLMFDGWSVGGGPIKKLQHTTITCAWLQVTGWIMEERT